MDKKAVIAVYEKIAGVTGLMVQAAEESNWDSLTGLESQCAMHMDTLRAVDSHEGLTDDELEYKMGLIKKILADDRRIRELAQPWMRELGELIKSSSNARKVNQAYGFNVAG